MTTDLAGQHPGKLTEMQQLFLAEGVKYNVHPSTIASSNCSTPSSPGGLT